MFARLFLVYLLIPSACAIYALIMPNVWPVLLIGGLLFVTLWVALYAGMKDLDIFFAIFLLSTATTIYIALRSITRNSEDFFGQGMFAYLGYRLVTAYAEKVQRKISGAGRFGMAMMLLCWSNLCAEPLVYRLADPNVRATGWLSPTYLPLGAALTCFMMGTVFLLAHRFVPDKDSGLKDD